MRTKKIFVLNLLICLCVLQSCDNPLREEVYSQISPEDVLTNQEGIESLLRSAYGHSNYADRQRINSEEWPTDIAFQTGGFENGRAVLFFNFTWDPATGILGGFYDRPYRAIRDANVLLENIEGADIPQELKDLFIAEARFLRAFNYYRLYNWFGPVPLRRSTKDPMELPRATDEQIKSFIESELLAVIPDLPFPGTESAYGRATSGAARGILAKFYLNTKQWQKAADMAQDVMDMNYYELFPSFMDLLKVENEGNKEMIWVNAASPEAPRIQSNTYISTAFPWGFEEWPRTGLEFLDHWRNPQSQYRLRDNFYHSFDPDDERRDPILVEYVNTEGDTVNLLDDYDDATRSFRYWPDPNSQGERHGNDVPIVRYADILLTRAEALNEVNGLNQTSIDLINDVRNRAGLTGADEISLTDFSSKEELRDHILKERAWEFYSEGLRRQDLIRHGKFIEYAHNRGVSNARPCHVRFPIPQSAMDSNKLLEQNECY